MYYSETYLYVFFCFRENYIIKSLYSLYKKRLHPILVHLDLELLNYYIGFFVKNQDFDQCFTKNYNSLLGTSDIWNHHNMYVICLI